MLISGNSNNHNNLKKNTSFGNGALVSATMNYLATNEAIGATAVDMGAMVIPRTVVDYTRTPEAGAETLRRELVSCLFFAAMGLFGLGAAKVLAPFVDAKKYNVPLDKITSGSDAAESLGQSWHNALGAHGKELTSANKEKVVDHYLNEVFGSVSGLDGENKVHINKSPDAQKEIVADIKKHLLDGSEYSIKDKEAKHKLVQKIIGAAGSAENLTLSVKGKKDISIGATDLLDNTYSMARTFMSDKVSEEFKNAHKVEEVNFLKEFKNFNKKKMGVGLAAASAFAISMQAMNRWLTKKKTGSEGFVAYKGQKAEKDNSVGFKAMKVAACGAMAAFSAYFMKDKGGHFKDIPKKLEFTKLMPTISQYKFIYGVTIIGRFLAASDKNELRESVTRDFLGFTSWLILGDIAARAMAKGFERIPGVSLLNHKNGKPSGLKQALMDSSMKTHEEIIYAKKENNLGKSFGEAAKAASENAKKSLKYRNFAQLGGYVVSGVLLGVGIPMLNKVITNKILESKKAEQAKNGTMHPAQQPQHLSAKKQVAVSE